jgi:beta-galactosidase/beta-glucuronidase
MAVMKSEARRLYLNNEPLFHIGPLDQGWWPDGLYTAPTDEALKYDIEVTRELGFNMARKHVKVEPARWYYWCDRLGLMVWQDMPSGFLSGERDAKSLYIDPWANNDAPREEVSAAQFESEWKEEIDQVGFFPSIVVWVPFNEGWRQYDTGRIAE